LICNSELVSGRFKKKTVIFDTAMFEKFITKSVITILKSDQRSYLNYSSQILIYSMKLVVLCLPLIRVLNHEWINEDIEVVEIIT
jgi:hypothetical protein